MLYIKRWANSSATLDEGYKQCFSKKAYPTEKLAKESINKRKDKIKHSLRYYKCEICSQFHLTKSPGKQQTYEPLVVLTPLEQYTKKHKELCDKIDLYTNYPDSRDLKKANELKKEKKALLEEIKTKGLRII